MTDILMSSAENWHNEALLSKHLAGQLRNHRLTLVLGAGISKPFGLPLWRELVSRIFARTRESEPQGHPPTRLLEYLRNQHFGGSRALLNDEIRRSLYEGVGASFSELRANDTLAAIGALVVSSVRGSASSVFTFNYDDLLELYLKYHGMVVCSVPQATHWSEKADVTVYHVNGLLPLDPKTPAEGEVVSDQEQYSRLSGDDSQPWRQLILSTWRSRTVVFIGVSGDDSLLDSLLVSCRDTHASKSDGIPYWAVWLSTSDDNVMKSQWLGRSVFPMIVRDYEKHLPDFLFDICQRAAQIG